MSPTSSARGFLFHHVTSMTSSKMNQRHEHDQSEVLSDSPREADDMISDDEADILLTISIR